MVRQITVDDVNQNWEERQQNYPSGDSNTIVIPPFYDQAITKSGDVLQRTMTDEEYDHQLDLVERLEDVYNEIVGMALEEIES